MGAASTIPWVVVIIGAVFSACSFTPNDIAVRTPPRAAQKIRSQRRHLAIIGYDFSRGQRCRTWPRPFLLDQHIHVAAVALTTTAIDAPEQRLAEDNSIPMEMTR